MKGSSLSTATHLKYQAQVQENNCVQDQLVYQIVLETKFKLTQLNDHLHSKCPYQQEDWERRKSLYEMKKDT